MGDDERHLPRNNEEWTLGTLQEHWHVVNVLNERFNTERDRRYSEVNIEREKALKIKEEADKAALGLAREIQTYKDEKANELREQISSERGSYATKADLAAMARELQATITTSKTNWVAVISVIYGIIATMGVVITLIVIFTKR